MASILIIVKIFATISDAIDYIGFGWFNIRLWIIFGYISVCLFIKSKIITSKLIFRFVIYKALIIN